MHACMYEFVFLSAARRLSKLQNRCMCHTRARRNTRHRMDGLWPGSRGASRHPASRHSWVAMQAARSRCRARARPHKAGGPIPTGFVGALRPAVSSPLGPGQALDRSAAAAARGEVGTNGAPAGVGTTDEARSSLRQAPGVTSGETTPMSRTTCAYAP